jgi:hypothetical protein
MFRPTLGLNNESAALLLNGPERGEIIFLSWSDSLQWVRVSSLPMLHYPTQTHHSRLDSSGWVMGPNDNTKHAQETDIYAFGGIRTYNPSKRAAADPRLRPRGHRNGRAKYVEVETVATVCPPKSGFVGWLFILLCVWIWMSAVTVTFKAQHCYSYTLENIWPALDRIVIVLEVNLASDIHFAENKPT